MTKPTQPNDKQCRGKAGRSNPPKCGASLHQRKRRRSAGAKRRRDQRSQDQAQRQQSDLPNRICYHRPPRNRAERLHRIGEQRRLANRRNRVWNHLSRAEKDRRIRFGSHARARSAHDVYELATLNCQIAHERELQAVQTWGLTTSQGRLLERCIGFAPSDKLLASNKLVRIETAYALAQILGDLWNPERRHFYWITLAHDDWNTRHDATVIDLEDIESRVMKVTQSLGLNWIGMIEADIFNNYPLKGRGLWVTPHVHILAWGDAPAPATQIRRRLDGSHLEASLLKVIDVKPVKTRRALMHLCSYMAKPNHQCKSVGAFNPITGKQKTYSVEHSVRPGLTLRLAEILSRVTIGDLVLVSGTGRRVKDQLLQSLQHNKATSGSTRAVVDNVDGIWQRLMPKARRNKNHVSLVGKPSNRRARSL